MGAYVAWLNSMESAVSVERALFIEAPLCHPSVMLRRASLVGVGGYQRRGWAEDYDLWMRLSLNGYRMQVLPEVLHVWRDHAHRLTRTSQDYAASTFFELKAHYLIQPYGTCFRPWGAGRDGKRLARALEARGARSRPRTRIRLSPR
jgi:hypothetical protein